MVWIATHAKRTTTNLRSPTNVSFRHLRAYMLSAHAWCSRWHAYVAAGSTHHCLAYAACIPCPADARTDKNRTMCAFCDSGYFAVQNVFKKMNATDNDKWEGLLCHRLDAIPGLQTDPRASQPEACKREVPLFLQRDTALSSALNVSWCDTTHMANSTEHCCLGLVRPQRGFWANLAFVVTRLQQLLRGEIQGTNINLPPYNAFAANKYRVKDFVSAGDYDVAQILEACSRPRQTCWAGPGRPLRPSITTMRFIYFPVVPCCRPARIPGPITSLPAVLIASVSPGTCFGTSAATATAVHFAACARRGGSKQPVSLAQNVLRSRPAGCDLLRPSW